VAPKRGDASERSDREFKRINILVNNAAVLLPGRRNHSAKKTLIRLLHQCACCGLVTRAVLRICVMLQADQL